MDSKRFDTWTRNRALRLSRRDALRLAGAGGASVALAASHLESLAQSTCSLTLHGGTAGDPLNSPAIDGTLTFSIGANGALSNASFVPASGAAQSVAGSITGRVIDLVIGTSAGQLLVLAGATDAKAPSCPGVAAGILTGPGDGDIGAWQATASSTQSGPNPGSASNGCAAPSFACGPNCCPSGATCTDTNQGICACPAGATQCGLICVTNCPNGQSLDLDSCTCTSTCTPDQGVCNSNTQCCSGFCNPNSGACETCQFLTCEGIGCVDPSIDPNNCGGCGIVCSAPTATCTDGACACQVDGLPCTKHFDCCSDSCLASGVCGCAPVGSDCSSFETTCCGRDEGATICTSGTCRYLDSRHACFSDNECITGICSNGGCIGCVDPGGQCTRSAECCNYNGLGCVNGLCPQ